MDSGLFIALRYLFAKKSHNVINVISAISAAGMAIGTAALIIILSVYNGFNGIIESNLTDLDPDIRIEAADGTRFSPDTEAFAAIEKDSRVKVFSCVLEDNVYLRYGQAQGLARAKGVDSAYEEDSPVSRHVNVGEFRLHEGELEMAAVGSGLAYGMGIHPRFVDRMELYYPGQGKTNPLLGPSISLSSVKLKPSCLFSISTDVDEDLIIVPLEAMRRLLSEEEKVSAIEIRTAGKQDKALHKELQQTLGSEFKVLDRYEQNPLIYKMMRYEKLAIFLILIFVVIIIAFNIFGSLTMLMIEKKDDIVTLRAIGAKESLIRRIFLLEGWMISLLGLAVGLVAGVGLTLIQQHFGIIRMPGGFFLQAYPVALKATDVLITSIGVAAVGYLIALLSASKRQEYGK